MTDGSRESAGPPVGGVPAYRAPHTEALLRRVTEMLEAARPMPLSASSMINKEETIEVLQQAIASLPEELKAARWLLKEREDFLARAEREADDIVAASRTRAEQLVQRAELVKSAEQRARSIIDEAEDRSRRLRLETEDWCDQKLGTMEAVLHKTLATVESGRERMQGIVNEATRPDLDEAEPEPEGFFDQDNG